jgi:hypothetical protein
MWRSEAWSHAACGFLVDAAWSVKAAPPALVLCCSQQLASLHFTEPAPSLDAQLMPLAAPQIFDQEVTSSSRGTPWSRSGHTTRLPPPVDTGGVRCLLMLVGIGSIGDCG